MFVEMETEQFEWLDEPNRGWMQEEWGWSHSLGCGFATFFYIIPGIIFLIVKAVARAQFTSLMQTVEENHKIAFEKTGCNYIWSVLHLGGHPNLPFDQRLLIGIKPGEIIFYDFKLNQLHASPISSVYASLNTVQTISGYQYVTTTEKVTVFLQENIKGRACKAEFDFAPYNPQQFIHVINEFSTKYER